MALTTYNKKRNFKATSEPKGKVEKKRLSRFVVQEHAARRLHYDFRLELGGVLKSWAVPKGPSLEPGEKRLAIEVEDHPVDYAGFEGEIPAGQYGAGKVIIWDKGTWSPVGDAVQGLSDGRLRFNLEGRKLRGQWTLVRMQRPKREGSSERGQWLLIRSKDEKSEHAGSDAPRRTRMLHDVEPELATLVDEAPRD